MTKRRTPGQGSIRKIKLRSGARAYRGEITVGYKLDDEGKKVPIKRTCQAPTKREVEEGLERLRARYRVAVDLDAEKMKLRELLDRWLVHIEVSGGYPDTTLTAYGWGATRACDQLDNPLVVKVSPVKLQDAINALAGELKPKSLNTIRVVLQLAFRQAVHWKIIPDSPAEHLDLPKQRTPHRPYRRALTVEEVARFRAALEGERLELAALIALLYGLRRGEAVALRYSQVNKELGTLTIDAQHQRNSKTRKLERVDTKGGDVRVFAMPEWLGLAVARQAERVATERRAMGERWTEADEGLLFVRETDGGRLDGKAVYDLVLRAAKRAELGKVRPHDLRRTLQSLLAAEGVDRNVRAEIAGHNDAETTDRHYRLVYQGEAGAALDKMHRLLGLNGPGSEGGDNEK